MPVSPRCFARSRHRASHGQRRRKDRITAEKINLQLHRLTEKARQVNIVPGLLVVLARPVIADIDDMVFNPIAQNIVQQRAFGFEFRR